MNAGHHELLAPFRLRQRFAIASLLTITAIALILGGLMSYILIDRMLQREGEVNMDFIQNLLQTDSSAEFFKYPDSAFARERFLGSMDHIASMNEPIRANAYKPDGTVLWSTDKQLIGQRFPVNDELEDALKGELVVHGGRLSKDDIGKAEHTGLDSKVSFYVESYIPIRLRGGSEVVGVMEVYKVPEALSLAIRRSVGLLWLAAALSALGLFVVLYWIVARAERVMLRQQALLNETQSLAVAVELSSAVAHNLRNPLSSIRSSAELLHSDPHCQPDMREQCQDITDAVDRADRWIHEFLRVSKSSSLEPSQILVLPLLKEAVSEFDSVLINRKINIHWAIAESLSALAHPAALKQIAVSLIANSLDAMDGKAGGGTLTFSARLSGEFAVLAFEDNGPGIPELAKGKLFQPFFSTKSGGLGIGLTLVKRFVEHWGGEVLVLSAVPKGTRIELRLRQSVGKTGA